MEFLARIRDGSESEIGNGYPLCKAVAADIESKNVIPLYCEAYSHSSPDVKSDNSQIFKAIDAIYKHVGDKGIHAIDRGGDRESFLTNISTEINLKGLSSGWLKEI